MAEPHVLVVEDDAAYRDLLMTALQCHGFETRGAENGAHALELVHEAKPDVILLDMLMPVMDGLRFLEELNRTGSGDTPVIVLTCMESRSLVVDSVKAGASEVLLKPAPFEILLEKLESAAGQPVPEMTPGPE